MTSKIPGSSAPRVRCYFLDTGYCVASEAHAIEGGARRRIAYHSLVALLRHPEHGWLLWDAGYTPRMLEATSRLPEALYRLVTPLCLRPDLAVVRQLARFGLESRDIQRIVVSHFHADHVAGLRDFPHSGFLATRIAYEDAASRRGFAALRRGILSALLPEDFAERAELLPAFIGEPLGSLGPTHDLFADGSLLLVALPGHARGQIGLLANTESGPVLFAADSCWLSRSIREERPPARITNLLADDPEAVRKTIGRVHAFAAANPSVRIVPSHCPEVFAELMRHEQGEGRQA
ncbi:MAG TPA: MBL fold metallo-hydrolase [Ktedonobacterales bacterium]